MGKCAALFTSETRPKTTDNELHLKVHPPWAASRKEGASKQIHPEKTCLSQVSFCLDKANRRFQYHSIFN